MLSWNVLLPSVGLLVWVVAIPLTSGTFFYSGEEKTAEQQAAGGDALGPAETLSGKIALVEADGKLLVVESARGVTYNFAVRGSTRISSGGQRLKPQDLAARKGAPVSIRFVPTRRGNIAQTIEISE